MMFNNLISQEASKVFVHDGVAFNVWGQVFSPGDYSCSRQFTDWLAVANELAGKTMIEVGSGCGYTGQYLLVKHSMGYLTQGDINPHAVACARENSQRLGIANHVTIAQSDVFDGIGKNVRADIIYWNHPWNCISPQAIFDLPIKRSFFDPGYNGLRKYLSEAPQHLIPEGRLFLGFNSRGHKNKMKKLASELGYEPVVFKHKQSMPNESADILYEMVKPSGAATIGFGRYSF